MIPPEVQEIAMQIGQFFLNKNNDDYAKTEQEIEKMRIDKISIAEETVTIELCRPGILIGRKGVQIDALQEF